MIIAGIDEAGYGPILGPMTIGCCAVEVPDADDLPCGWKLLNRLVSKKRDPAGKKLHVNDSKKVYSPSIGLAELEKSILCLLATTGTAADTLDGLMKLVAASSIDALQTRDWYHASADETFPIENDALSIRIASNHARVECERARVRIRHLSAHVVPESKLNQMFDATNNKSATSFSFVAQHMDTLLTKFSDQPLIIFCDRQGGRSHYREVLMQMFPDWSLGVLGESESRSAYQLSLGTSSAQIIFAEKAEEQCIGVALASMLAKYLREATMHRFNRYWQQHEPTLKPTAGYWTDGLRFLKDIEPLCARLGIDHAALARSR